MRHRLAARWLTEDDWLLSHLPDARRFVKDPSERNFRSMLNQTKTGADMMKQAWLFSEVMLTGDEQMQAWQARSTKASLDEPFSVLQEEEFCRTHLGENLEPSSVPPGPAGQLARTAFYGERRAGQGGTLTGEDFALGHALMLSYTKRLSLAQSAHLLHALASDMRPTMARAEGAQGDSLRVRATPHAADVQAARRAALRAHLPAYGKLASNFRSAETQKAIQKHLPKALEDTRIWMAEQLELPTQTRS